MSDRMIIILVIIILFLIMLILSAVFLYRPIREIKQTIDNTAINLNTTASKANNIINEINTIENDICKWIADLKLPTPGFCKNRPT